ncbi:MAG TPA: hypothetical protein VFE60_04835, partial [Roseiarcus sp.]|nr:hypothetical protein [Roseiarcus sp.]
QTKERANREYKLRPKPARQSSTLLTGPTALIQILDRLAAHVDAPAPGPAGAFVPIYTIRGSCGQGAMNAVARRLDDAPAEARHGRNRAMGELARPDHAGMRTFVVLMTPSNELVSEHP